MLTTNDLITLPIPRELAEDFIKNGAYVGTVSRRPVLALTLGEGYDLGFWRVEQIVSRPETMDNVAGVLATLRRVLP
jgi:hypothetical protein